jgi:hypothetical protein
MFGNPCGLITAAERHFAARVGIVVPPEGLSQRHTQITAWRVENLGRRSVRHDVSGTQGMPNNVLSIYFADASLASGFVASGANQRLGTRLGGPRSTHSGPSRPERESAAPWRAALFSRILAVRRDLPLETRFSPCSSIHRSTYGTK